MRVVGAYFFEEAYSAGEPTQYARQLMAALAERFGRVILVTVRCCSCYLSKHFV